MTKKRSVENTILVARSLPVEEMDAVLDSCCEKWPEKDIVVISDILTQAEMFADSRVKEVIFPNELSEGFRGVWNTREKADVLVVPVGNRTGAGYARMFRFLKRVSVREYYIASHRSDLQRIRSDAVTWRIYTEQMLRYICAPLGFLGALLYLSREPGPGIN